MKYLKKMWKLKFLKHYTIIFLAIFVMLKNLRIFEICHKLFHIKNMEKQNHIVFQSNFLRKKNEKYEFRS